MDLTYLLPYAEGLATTVAVAALFSYVKPYNLPKCSELAAAHRRSRIRIPAADDLYVAVSGRGFSAGRVAVENASFEGIALRWGRFSPAKGSAVKIVFAGTNFETTVVSHDKDILRLRYMSSVTPASAALIRSACLHGRNKPLTQNALAAEVDG